MDGQHAGVYAEDLGDPASVAGRLDRDPILSAQALSQRLQLVVAGRDPADGPASLVYSDLAEVAVDIDPDIPHGLTSSSRNLDAEDASAHDTDSGSQPSRTSRRGGQRYGLATHRANGPALHASSREASVPALGDVCNPFAIPSALQTGFYSWTASDP